MELENKYFLSETNYYNYVKTLDLKHSLKGTPDFKRIIPTTIGVDFIKIKEKEKEYLKFMESIDLNDLYDNLLHFLKTKGISLTRIKKSKSNPKEYFLFEEAFVQRTTLTIEDIFTEYIQKEGVLDFLNERYDCTNTSLDFKEYIITDSYKNIFSKEQRLTLFELKKLLKQMDIKENEHVSLFFEYYDFYIFSHSRNKYKKLMKNKQGNIVDTNNYFIQPRFLSTKYRYSVHLEVFNVSNVEALIRKLLFLKNTNILNGDFRFDIAYITTNNRFTVRLYFKDDYDTVQQIINDMLNKTKQIVKGKKTPTYFYTSIIDLKDIKDEYHCLTTIHNKKDIL